MIKLINLYIKLKLLKLALFKNKKNHVNKIIFFLNQIIISIKIHL